MFSKIATNLCKTTVARRSLSAQASPATQNGIRHDTGLNFELNDEEREIIDLAEKVELDFKTLNAHFKYLG